LIARDAAAQDARRWRTPRPDLPAPSADAASPAPAFSDAYRRYALGLLLVVYVFNFIDRQILTILAEAIRLDLGLSDSALGRSRHAPDHPCS